MQIIEISAKNNNNIFFILLCIVKKQLTHQRTICARLETTRITRSRCSHHRSARSNLYFVIVSLSHWTRVVSPFARASGAAVVHNASSPSLVTSIVAVCRTYVERQETMAQFLAVISLSLSPFLSFSSTRVCREPSRNCFNVLITALACRVAPPEEVCCLYVGIVKQCPGLCQ